MMLDMVGGFITEERGHIEVKDSSLEVKVFHGMKSSLISTGQGKRANILAGLDRLQEIESRKIRKEEMEKQVCKPADQ